MVIGQHLHGSIAQMAGKKHLLLCFIVWAQLLNFVGGRHQAVTMSSVAKLVQPAAPIPQQAHNPLKLSGWIVVQYHALEMSFELTVKRQPLDISLAQLHAQPQGLQRQKSRVRT